MNVLMEGQLTLNVFMLEEEGLISLHHKLTNFLEDQMRIALNWKSLTMKFVKPSQQGK